jgi:hypothetical protein
MLDNPISDSNESDEYHPAISQSIVGKPQEEISKSFTEHDINPDSEEDSQNKTIKKNIEIKKKKKKPAKKSNIKKKIINGIILITNPEVNPSLKINKKLLGNKRRVKRKFSKTFRKKPKLEIIKELSCDNSNKYGGSTEASLYDFNEHNNSQSRRYDNESVSSIYISPEEEYDSFEYNSISCVCFNYDCTDYKPVITL